MPSDRGIVPAAPSANRFGRISPTDAQHVTEELGDRIHWILDGGPCAVGVESTILRIHPSGLLELLRPGMISAAELAKTTGRAVQSAPTHLETLQGLAQVSPGLLENHYAPRKPLFILPAPLLALTEHQKERIRQRLAPFTEMGFLQRQGTEESSRKALGELNPAAHFEVRILSIAGIPADCAQNLFRLMRELDASAQTQILLAEPGPSGEGLAHALRDRLAKAGKPLYPPEIE